MAERCALLLMLCASMLTFHGASASYLSRPVSNGRYVLPAQYPGQGVHYHYISTYGQAQAPAPAPTSAPPTSPSAGQGQCDLSAVPGVPNMFMASNGDVLTCPTYLIFNPAVCVCDYDPNNPIPFPPASGVSTTPPPGQCDLSAVPGVPNMFMASNGDVLTCPTYLIFNPAVCVCDYDPNNPVPQPSTPGSSQPSTPPAPQPYRQMDAPYPPYITAPHYVLPQPYYSASGPVPTPTSAPSPPPPATTQSPSTQSPPTQCPLLAVSGDNKSFTAANGDQLTCPDFTVFSQEKCTCDHDANAPVRTTTPSTMTYPRMYVPPYQFYV